MTKKKSNSKIIFLIIGLVIGFPLVGFFLIFVLGLGSAVAVPNYLNYVDKARSVEVQSYIKHIVEASKIYYTENGYEVDDIEILIGNGYFDNHNSILEEWEFDLEFFYDEGPSGYIYAISTYRFEGGGGKEVCYDIATDVFGGYGSKLECGESN